MLQNIADKFYALKVYVPNQVGEILESTDKGDWQHIDGKMNLADMCTRGLMDPAHCYIEINMESHCYLAQIF